MSIHVMRVKFAGEVPHESGIETIALANGTLLVNNSIVDCEVRNGFHNWVRAHADGTREFGSLKISMVHGMCRARGVVLFNDRKVGFSADSMLEYSMTIVRPGGNQPWYSLAMGFVEDEKEGPVPTSKLLIGGDEDGSKFLQTYSLVNLGTKTVFPDPNDKNHHLSYLTARIDLDLDYCVNFASLYPDFYSAADVTFSLDYTTLSGQAYEYLPDVADPRGYPLIGECTSSALLAMIRGIVQDAPVRLEGARQVGGHNASDADFLVAGSLQGAGDLSVIELYSLPTPNMEKLHEYSFDKLKTLMLYAIDDDTRHFFNEKKPVVGGGVLKQSDVDLLGNPDVKSFLINDFSTGYLTEAFSKAEIKAVEEEFKKIPTHDEKMSFFWTGDGATSFSKSKGYNAAMSNIMDNTFADFVPGLAPYRSDKKNDWAKMLYEYCTSKTVFTGLALQTQDDQQGRVIQLSSILHALDPTPRLALKGQETRPPVSYSTALHEQVVNRRLFEVTKNFLPGDEIEMKNFLTEYFTLEFALLLADPGWQGKVHDEANKDLAQLMEEFKVTTTDRLVTEMATIIADSVHLMVVNKNKNMSLSNRINELAKDEKSLSAKFGKFLTMGVYAFAIMGTVTAFMNWGKLKPEEKKVVVKNIVAVTADIFSDLTVWFAAGKLTSIEAKGQALMEAGMHINDAVQLERATVICERIGVQLEIEMPEIGAAGLALGGAEAANDMMKLEQLGAAAAKWEKIAMVTSKFARTMTVAAMGAACVAGGYQIARDFATGQPTAAIVFDIISTVGTAIAFIVEVGAGIAALCGMTVLSVIPIIGVVAAVIGIVAAFVGLFLHKKPISPAQQFVRDQSAPFIGRLLMPDPKWLEEQRKKDTHLENSPASPSPQALAV
jgi:hypothetical protein